jgi:RNA polymerase sigma factor (TIGR02999 family)
LTEVTRILSAIEQGDPHAAEQLLPLVYNELRHLAAAKLAQEKPGQTLQATALVHEAYLRLVPSPGRESGESEARWNNRGHFFAAAAEAMRRILIDQARRRSSKKRGGAGQRLSLEAAASIPAADASAADELLAVDECLQRLEAEAPIKARLVKLRYFAGLSMEDAARSLGISAATARRYWIYARSWLHAQMHGD